jgi:hypothetical protein
MRLTSQWSGHHVHPMPRPAPTRHHGGSPTSTIQVPRKAKDHRFQEVGFHFPRQGRLRGIEEGAQGYARWSLRPGKSHPRPSGRSLAIMQGRGLARASYITCTEADTDNQFLKAKGPLLPNLRTAETRAI